MSSFVYEEPVFSPVDEEFVVRARSGDLRAAELLMVRYRPLVETKARSYYLAGADHDDVVQEGMIGLFKAIRDFDTDRRSRFRPFAEMCVQRQIITAVKTATRQKHIPLNGSVSLDRTLFGDDDATLLDLIADQTSLSPEDAVLKPPPPKSLHEEIGHMLSDLEKKVLRCYLEGKSYREISQELRCHQKSIDNALQRIKRKIHTYFKPL